MKKKFLKFLIIGSIMFASCTKDETNNDPILVNVTQKEALKPSEINAKIEEIASANNIFDWSQVSDQVLWSAALQGQNLMTIGFGITKNDFDRSKLSNNQSIQKELFDIIERYEGKKIKDILVSTDAYLNLFDVLIEKQETIIALKRSKALRYIEPADYRYLENNADYQKQKSSSGCGYETATLTSSDYTTISPNAKVPWAFYQHNIPAAWNISTGTGITIGVVDTGLSGNQTLMGSSFNDGQSSGRTVQRFGTFVDSFWPWSTSTDGINDKCGHGTSMSSVATSPRNNKGLPVGVAYNANLVTYRASSDVLLEGYHEQNGVKNAFTGLANNANVKIISMSMGYIFSVGKIEDGIKYAYSKGKLIFCAGGTSTTFTNFVGVIFPAWMSETVAVTGIKEGNTYQKCDICHTGNKIDFTIVMERLGSGKTVPVNSYYDNQSNYVGGSSVATATTAGIAALVWSKNPSWTRDQVLNKMKQSSSFYPNKNSEFGYGNINALLAVQ